MICTASATTGTIARAGARPPAAGVASGVSVFVCCLPVAVWSVPAMFGLVLPLVSSLKAVDVVLPVIMTDVIVVPIDVDVAFTPAAAPSPVAPPGCAED